MKFLDLQLLRFGHFSDTVLDFGEQPKLHLIYGANEAGKSTTLRAVLGLLFGIPMRSSDHFLHASKKLRIGARLDNSRGQQIHIVRRKGRSKTLLDPSDKPLADNVLQGFLGGVDQTLFSAMFGLNHQALVEGGQALVDGKGELGESLFSAGSGLRGIRQVRLTLEQEAAAIYTARGQNPNLNRALKHYKEAKDKTKLAQLKPSTWQEKSKQVNKEIARLDELEQQHRAQAIELHRWQRLERVLPDLNLRQTLLAEKKNLGEVILLPDNSAEQREQTLVRLRHLDRQQQKLQADLQRCEEQLAAVQIPAELLAQATAMEELRDQQARVKAASNDLPGVQEKFALSRDDIRDLLRELGRDPELDLQAAKALAVDVATQAAIRQLGQDGVRLNADLQAAQQALASSEIRQQQLRKQLDDLAPEHDTQALQQLLNVSAQHGDLELTLRETQRQESILKEQAKNQLAALGLWQGTLEDVATLAVPVAETIDRFQSYFERLNSMRQRLELQQDNIRNHLRELNARLQGLESQGDIPSETQLRQARAERDEIWAQLVTHCLQDTRSAAELQPFIDDYTKFSQYADTLADQLRTDAERAAQHVTLSADLTRYHTENEALDGELKALAALEHAQTEQWQTLWATCEIIPLPPADMKSWLTRLEQLRMTVERWCEQQHRCAELKTSIDELRQKLDQALADLSQARVSSEETLTQILVRAAKAAADVQTLAATRQRLQQELEQQQSDLSQRQQACQQCEQALQDWRERWATALVPLALQDDASSEVADAVLASLARLVEKIKDAQRYQIRIEQMHHYTLEFGEQALRLCQNFAPDLAELSPLEATTQLLARYAQASTDAQVQKTLQQRQAQINNELAEHTKDQQAAQDLLAQLQTQAKVTSLEKLEQAEQRSRRYREIDHKLNTLEERLSREGVPLTQLEAEAAEVEAETVSATAQQLSQQLDALNRQIGQQRERIGKLKSELKAMNGDDRAAQAASDAEAALADIKIQVADYVRLKLSAILLNREIERYRERNQGPIIHRAGKLFQRMTLNAYDKLGTAFSDDDRLELRCVRADGQAIAVTALSEGTRDQLYLALRLASLERHAEHHEPLPLIVDDILINFDDQRAQATLETLSELAQNIQILFFTHHHRLLELAQNAVPAQRLQIHQLRSN